MMVGQLKSSLWFQLLLILLLLLLTLFLIVNPVLSLPNPVVPGTFNLVEPLNGAVYNQWQEYQPWIWEVAENATGYDFKVERILPDQVVIFDQQNWMGFCENGKCYNGFPADQLTGLTDGTYQWNVTARDGTDLTPSTNGPQTFVLDSTAVLPGQFGLWFPLNGMAVLDPADLTFFNWGQSANATTMDFLLTEVSPTPGDVITKNTLTTANDADALNCDNPNGGCALTFSAADQALLVDGGVYEWRITAHAADGSRPADGNPFTLKVDSTAVLPGPFELWYPLEVQVFNAGTDIPFFKWRNAENAITYDLNIDNFTTSAHFGWSAQTAAADSDPLTCSTRECVFTLDSTTQAALVTGDYQWYVFAHSEDSVGATNSGHFTIDPTAVLPGDFKLVNPPVDIVFQLPDNVTPLEWEESAGSLTYHLRLWQLSPDETMLIDLTGLTPAADTDQLSCASGRCRFILNPDQLIEMSNAVLEWEVFAENADGFVPALNSVYSFTTNSFTGSLLLNGGMEDDADADKIPDNWKGKLLVGDKRMCDKVDKTFAYTGTCAFRFKGGVNEASKLQQVINLEQAVFPGSLQLAFFAEKKNLTTGLTVKLIIGYVDTNLDNGKIVYELPEGTDLYTGVIQSLVPAGEFKKVKLQLRFKNNSAGGKVYFDTLQLLGLIPTSLLPLPAAAAPLPLPASSSSIQSR